MILTDKIDITITNQGKYWSSLGYGTHKHGTTISVFVKDLPDNSNKKVECRCDECDSIFERQYQLLKRVDSHRCYQCAKKHNGQINGSADRARERSKSYLGPNHPRWNPNKTAFKAYSNKVRWLSEKEYLKHRELINPDNLPRTLCGIDEGYQLDHKISIKKAFDLNMPEETVAAIENLQLLPWQQNRSKGYKK
jgi:hypothetical protein